MSDYRTVFRPEAQSELRKIPRDMALRILANLTELESDPLGFSTTALVSQPERRRLRVGDYRVVYMIDDGKLVVWVAHIGHPSTVYDTCFCARTRTVGKHPLELVTPPSGPAGRVVSGGCFHDAMSTVCETAALLPDPAELSAT